MQPIDYKQIAQILMMHPQLVGDVLPFARKAPGYLNLTEGARPRLGGGGVSEPRMPLDLENAVAFNKTKGLIYERGPDGNVMVRPATPQDKYDWALAKQKGNVGSVER